MSVETKAKAGPFICYSPYKKQQLCKASCSIQAKMLKLCSSFSYMKSAPRHRVFVPHLSVRLVSPCTLPETRAGQQMEGVQNPNTDFPVVPGKKYARAGSEA